MDSSTAAPTTAAGLAQGFSRLFDFAVPMREPIPAYGVGEGYIVSTAEDLARYTSAVMNNQVDHFVSAAQLTQAVEAVVLGRPAPPVNEGWSVRWMGWALGALVVGLIVLHTRNLMDLRSWRERARVMSPGKRARDVAISFIIPTVTLVVVFW